MCNALKHATRTLTAVVAVTASCTFGSPVIGAGGTAGPLASRIAALHAQQAQHQQSRHQQPAPESIDAIFAEYDGPGSPGCALGVISHGRIVYERGYGSANLDYGIPNSPDMLYYVGSVSKQFTAAAVALLAAEGLISLDDDVRRHIPELPDYGRPITIRQLVHHTAGLRDIYTLMSLAGIRMEDVFTNEDALALIARQNQLNFAPGDAYLYSNSGYWLLGQIVERVSGKSLRVYADEKIFHPLGMSETRFHDEPHRVLPRRVMSYGRDGDAGFRITYLGNFDKVGAGGLYTTLADLARWDANFYDSKIGGSEFLRTLHTRGVLNSGDTLAYAFGINVQRRRGLDMVRHSGSLMGFRADLVRYPGERFTVVTMCNLGSIDAAGLADRVTELYLGHRLEPAGSARQQAAAAPAAATATATAAAGVPATSGGAPLGELAGRYRSEELDVVYRIEAEGGALVLHRPPGGPQLMRAAGSHRFSVGSQVFNFERDAAGRTIAFTVDAGRVRNIRFERLP
jgi:CubicO group peptidase (beta-lactamase class C family)